MISKQSDSRSPVIFFTEHTIIFDSPSHLSRLKSLAQIRTASSSEKNVLSKEVREATVIVSDYVPITAEIMESAPHLKGIISFGVGFNQIDVEAAAERGIFVANLRGSNSEAVAEHAVSLMLSALRNLPKCEQYLRNGKWVSTESAEYPGWTTGKELYGKTLGLVGIGEIGRRVARICARGFNMRVLATDPYVTKDQASQLGAELVDLATLLRSSDVVSVHVPLSKETKGLIGAKEIAMIKKTAYIVNTSRGPIVDEPSLIQALKEKRIAAAGLDVFEKEPIPKDSPLIQLENIVLTPHIAGFTQEAVNAMNDMVVDEATRIVRGEIPKNLVNRPQLVARGHLDAVR